MRNYSRSRRVYFKSRSRRPAKRHILGFALITAAVLVLYCLLMPNNSGMIGHLIAKKSRYFLGLAYFVVPVLISWLGLRIIREGKIEKPWHLATSQIIVLWVFATFFSLVTQNLPSKNLGGYVGKYSEMFLEKALGTLGAYLLLIIAIFVILNFSLSHPPLYLLKLVRKQIDKEWREWKEIRKLNKAVNDKVPIIKLPKRAPAEKLPSSNIVSDFRKGLEDNMASLKEKVKEKFIKSSEKKSAARQAKERKAFAGIRRESVNEPVVNSEQSEAPEAQVFNLPDISLLSKSKQKPILKMEEELVESAALLERTLLSFNIQAKIIDVNPGPVITRFDIQPGTGVKVSSIINLSNDIALSMKAPSIRVVAPIPGKAAVGIEIPNRKSELVTLSEIIAHESFTDSKSLLTFVLGKTIEGNVCVTDLIPMPHLLIAGVTGSGKSVCVHSIICSILFKALPDQVKLMLIDPKRLELPVYNGLPHLYDPNCSADDVEVITNPRDAAKSLEKLVKVMEMRYEKFAEATVRNIDAYNEYAEKNNLPKEFFIVVIIDELADLMMVAPKEIEDSIQRLAQMARAVGIHLILATQRPSVDVITGVIKANLPCRIAFQVLSKVDSRVILDMGGADDLIGKGDMLFLASGEPKPVRLQGAFVHEEDIENIVRFYKNQGTPRYSESEIISKSTANKFKDEKSNKDVLEALKLVKERRRVSHDLLKANFGSSSRASNILSLLEVRGFIKKPDGSNRWEIFFDRIEDYVKEAEAGGETVPGGNMKVERTE